MRDPSRDFALFELFDDFAHHAAAVKEKLDFILHFVHSACLILGNSGNEVIETARSVVKIRNRFVKVLDGIIAKQFLDRDKGEYTLKPMKAVLEELHFTAEEKKTAHNTLNSLNKQYNDGTSQQAFISKIKKGAIANYEKYGILPSVTIAQAVLESNWGRSGLTKDHNNLFGIKGHNWDGATANMKTKENYNDHINSDFRVYASLEDSIKDHGQFLAENKRYEKNGLFDGQTYQEQTKALEDVGYSTATNENGEKIYSSMLMDIIQTYQLQVIDSQAVLNQNA